MPPVPISPAIKTLTNNSIEISRTNASLQGVALGEILQTTVLEKSAGNKYMLALKNLQIPATSTIPLNVGEKLLVKVNSLQPQIVLTVVENQNQGGDVKINEKLRQWRANPESLLQVIGKVNEFAKLLQTGDLPLKISKSDIEKLIKLFDNIIFSPRTKNNPLFLKDFVSRIGLLLEISLRQLVAEASKGRIEKPLEDNLKALLLKLSSAVQEALRENSKLDSQTTIKLMNISSFAEEALKTIETRQALNAVFQDSDNGLALQIPLALGEGMRLADIFIMPDDKKGKGKNKFSTANVVIFLDLDILGKIAANARISEGTFRCIIKCEREEVKDLISNELDMLKNALSGCGYHVDYIDCVQESGLESQREEFLERQSFAETELVNFFA